jgi:hypothetical protein
LLGQNLWKDFLVLIHLAFLHLFDQQIKWIDKVLNGSTNPAMVPKERATWNAYSVSKLEVSLQLEPEKHWKDDLKKHQSHSKAMLQIWKRTQNTSFHLHQCILWSEFGHLRKKWQKMLCH